MKTFPHAPNVPRQEALFHALPATVDQLRRCRAGDIPEGYIDDYVALDWLKWDGGALRLTASGDKVCQQIARDLS